MWEAFADLSTPLVADACVRCSVPLRAAPSGIRPVVAGQQIAGRVLPVRHYGSVDVFLEALAGHKLAMCWSSTMAAAWTSMRR